MKTKICKINGCDIDHYAKGFCRTHYTRNRRTPKIKQACSVSFCNKQSAIKGFCKFHYGRHLNGIQMDRPYGNKGEMNHRWNGGTSLYPNHYEMKKVRIYVLEMANYICHYCGKDADRIHHLDHTRDNHSVENFVSTCNKCNLKRRKQNTTSKYKRLYGKTLKQMAEILNKSQTYVLIRHRKGVLKEILTNSHAFDKVLTWLRVVPADLHFNLLKNGSGRGHLIHGKIWYVSP